MKDDVKEISIFIYDAEKIDEEELLGSAKISIHEIYEKNSDEKSDYLVREDGLRTRSRVSFSYKLEPSKVFVLKTFKFIYS